MEINFDIPPIFDIYPDEDVSFDVYLDDYVGFNFLSTFDVCEDDVSGPSGKANLDPLLNHSYPFDWVRALYHYHDHHETYEIFSSTHTRHKSRVCLSYCQAEITYHFYSSYEERKGKSDYKHHCGSVFAEKIHFIKGKEYAYEVFDQSPKRSAFNWKSCTTNPSDNLFVYHLWDLSTKYRCPPVVFDPGGFIFISSWNLVYVKARADNVSSEFIVSLGRAAFLVKMMSVFYWSITAAANTFPTTLQCIFDCIFGKVSTSQLAQLGIKFVVGAFQLLRCVLITFTVVAMTLFLTGESATTLLPSALQVMLITVIVGYFLNQYLHSLLTLVKLMPFMTAPLVCEFVWKCNCEQFPCNT